MNAEARYFRVGLFVFGGIFTVVAMAVGLGGGSLFAERVLYESYFDESVQGLEVGSPVKLRGVQIATVKSILMWEEVYGDEVQDRPERFRDLVVVRMEARVHDLPDGALTPQERVERLAEDIGRGMRLRLARSGITGVTFIEAQTLDPARHPALEPAWEPETFYVPSTPSTMSTITSAAERLAFRLEEADIAGLIAEVDQLVTNVSRAFGDLEVGEVQGEAQAVLVELRRTLRQVRGDVEAAGFPEIGASARDTLDEANATLVRVRRLVEGGNYDLEMTMENLRVASENLRELTETVRAQPSLLLRSEAPERRQSGSAR